MLPEQIQGSFGEFNNVGVQIEDEESDDDSDKELEDDSGGDALAIAVSVLQQGSIPSSIHLENSNNVQIGPQVNYNAPVTVNQYVNVRGGKDKKEEELLALPSIKTSPYDHTFAPGKTAQSTDSARAITWLASYHRRQLIWGLIVATIVLVIIIAMVLHFCLPNNATNDATAITTSVSPYISIPTEQPPPDVTPDPNLRLNEHQDIYARSYWSVYPPIFTRSLKHPTPYVVVAHSAEQSCSEPISCSETLRGIQAYHVNTFEQPDIGYNFMIDTAGNIYEGRGWDHTNFFSEYTKRRNIGVCFLGNYVYLEFSEKQQKSFKDLLALGLKLNKLSEDYKLIAHNQLFATLSPGRRILAVIDSWPHRCLSDCAIPFNTTESTADPETNSESPTNNTDIQTTVSTAMD